MPTEFPFYDKQLGPEIREKLNEMYAVWMAALETAVGKDGWSPLLRLVADGQRQVIQLHDWIGGTTSKPATGYLGAAGLVATPAEAVDIKGGKGDNGDAGPANELAGVDVSTGDPGTEATGEITGEYPEQRLVLVVPRGDPGQPGPTPNLTPGTIETGAPGTPVVATITGTAENPVLNLRIPQGQPGTGTGDLVGPSGVEDLQMTQFDGPTGKLVRALNISGMLKLDGGRPFAAVAGEDFVVPSGNVATAGKWAAPILVNGLPVDGSVNVNLPVVTTRISAGDFNNFTTPGKYNVQNNADAAVILNIPEALAGALTVDLANGPGVIQTYTTYVNTAARRTYQRSMHSTLAWGGWCRVYTTIDPQAAQAPLVSGTNIKSINGQSVLGSGDLVIESGSGIDEFEYGDRDSLRTLVGEYALVDMLGLFTFKAGSTEADDDESCFATATGRWLLKCPSFDLIEAWNLPRTAMLGGRVISGVINQTVATVAANITVGVTGSIQGVEPGDTIIATPPGALGNTAASSCYMSTYAYCNIAGTVVMALSNSSAAAITLNPRVVGNWAVTVVKAN